MDDIPELHTIKVRNRRIQVDYPTLVQNNVKTDTVTLDLDGEWDGLQVVINLGECGKGAELAWSGIPVTIPASLMTQIGSVPASVVGYSSDGAVRLVTAAANTAFSVISSGCVEQADPPEDPTSIMGQLLEAADNANNAASAATTAADAANTAAGSANKAKDAANTAAESANAAAESANSAADAANGVIDACTEAAASANEAAASANAAAEAADTVIAGNVLKGTLGPSEVLTTDDAWAAKPLGLKVYGNTRQNLWANPSGTSNGVTVTSNDDGSITISGSASSAVFLRSDFRYVLKPSTAYTISVSGPVSASSQNGFAVWEYYDGGELAHICGSNMTNLTFTTRDDTLRCSCAFYIGNQSVAFSAGTYRVMLREATEKEIAAAQQTPSTLPEGGTADLPQDYPVTLPADPSIYAANDDFDWCPPGLNSVESLEIVTAGKNLLTETLDGVAPKAPDSQFTTLIDFGKDINFEGMTLSVTADTDITYQNTTAAMLDFLESDGTHHYIVPPQVIGASGTMTAGMQKIVNVPNVKFRYINVYWFRSNYASFDIDCRLKFQLELGSTATAYESPAVTSIPIDLQGNELCSLPDGTRDVLDVMTGEIEKSVGYIASYAGEDVGDDYVASALTDTGEIAQGAQVVYRLSDPQTIQLTPPELPALPAPNLTAYADSDVACDIEIEYARDVNIAYSKLEQAITATAAGI